MDLAEKRGDILYIVVPCYNEEEVLEHTAQVMREKIKRLTESGQISSKSKIMFVNDGSKDKTWNIIHKLCDGDIAFTGLSFSRNYGHQSAILAGMISVSLLGSLAVNAETTDTEKKIYTLSELFEMSEEEFFALDPVDENNPRPTSPKAMYNDVDLGMSYCNFFGNVAFSFDFLCPARNPHPDLGALPVGALYL